MERMATSNPGAAVLFGILLYGFVLLYSLYDWVVCHPKFLHITKIWGHSSSGTVDGSEIRLTSWYGTVSHSLLRVWDTSQVVFSLEFWTINGIIQLCMDLRKTVVVGRKKSSEIFSLSMVVKKCRWIRWDRIRKKNTNSTNNLESQVSYFFRQLYP